MYSTLFAGIFSDVVNPNGRPFLLTVGYDNEKTILEREIFSEEDGSSYDNY